MPRTQYENENITNIIKVTSDRDIVLPHLWAATIKPGAQINMRMWPADLAPLRGFYGPPPFIVNPHAPNVRGHNMHLARMRQMQQQRMAAMRHPPPPPGMPPPPPGGRSFPAPRRVTIPDWKDEYRICEKEGEQLMFVDFVEELEKIQTATVADLLRKLTTLTDVSEVEELGHYLDADSDYDSDDSTSTSSSTEIIND